MASAVSAPIPLNVLLLEDHPSDAELVLLELRQAGFAPHWRRVDSEAPYLEELAQPPDVILADYSLPQFDALSALHLLQERELDVPFIVVTGAMSEEAAVECMKQGAADYLMKDRLSRLGQAVQHALAAKRVRDEKREAEAALRHSEARFRRLAENARDVICRYELRPQRGFSYMSPAVEHMLGYTPQEFYADPDLPPKLIDPEDVPHLLALVRDRASAQSAVLRVRHKNGPAVWTELRTAHVYDNAGRLVAIEAIVRDITERRTLEQQLAYQAFHDPLTGLPNRALFLDRLERALVRASRHAGTVAVLFLDLDRFKVVNDSLGHDMGDKLLVAVGERLLGCIRAGDTVARRGGDEFTVLLEDVADVNDATIVAERIIKALEEPVSLGGQEVYAAASIGIVLSRPGRGRRGPKAYAEELLRDADVAMYRAKSKGKARYEVHDPSMHNRAIERLVLETDLRRAIERQEFRVYYQPKLRIENGSVEDLEALVRWQHPKRGLTSPLDFIPLAEETGLIIPLGQLVLAEACRQARAWQERNGVDQPLRMCVNLSARQFQQANLVDQVAQVLETAHLDPRLLELEITESVIMEDAQSTIGTLRALKCLGVRLAVDDFGTGYSSLSYLRRFPVDCLKIDRSFVGGLGRNAEDTAIVGAIVRLGHALGLEVTAEGVETAAQMEQLRTLGCDLAQGFYFAKPLPTRETSILLHADGVTPLYLSAR